MFRKYPWDKSASGRFKDGMHALGQWLLILLFAVFIIFAVIWAWNDYQDCMAVEQRNGHSWWRAHRFCAPGDD